MDEHRQRFRVPPVPRTEPLNAIIQLVGEAGLTGRGGAGFPTARKLAAVASRPGPRVVVVNGTEGEPPSLKDQVLMGYAPHLVIDGAVLAAAAVGAAQIRIGVDRTRTGALAAVRHAARERAHELGPLDLQVQGTPPRYLAGEERSLVQWMNGGPAVPTAIPPRPFESGVAGWPTLVQNVETLAHLALIAANGWEWFRQVGTDEEPGTLLITVGGAVAKPGVIEAALGTPVHELVAAAGGATEAVRAVLVGGFFGRWVPVDALAVPYSRRALAEVGAAPGSGVVAVLPESVCGLAETARILHWFAAESAGQCGPCLYGLADLAQRFSLIVRGQAASADLQTVRRWLGEIQGRGACHHPDGAVGLLRSALGVFAEDLADHLSGRPCTPAATAATCIPVPTPPEMWR